MLFLAGMISGQSTWGSLGLSGCRCPERVTLPDRHLDIVFTASTWALEAVSRMNARIMLYLRLTLRDSFANLGMRDPRSCEAGSALNMSIIKALRIVLGRFASSYFASKL